MKIRFLFVLILLFSCEVCQADEKKLKIALIGDSTVATQSGWGPAFAERFNDQVEVINYAKGGASSKSWLNDQRLPPVLKAEPDYVLIQFGHNDQPGKGPERETDPETTFRAFLTHYVKEFQRIGTKPILLSSVTRRRFDDGKIRTTLTPWAEASREVAREMEIPFINLHALSVDHHNKLGREASMAYNFKEGDTTHFNKKGADAIADLILNELKVEVPELAGYLK